MEFQENSNTVKVSEFAFDENDLAIKNTQLILMITQAIIEGFINNQSALNIDNDTCANIYFDYNVQLRDLLKQFDDISYEYVIFVNKFSNRDRKKLFRSHVRKLKDVIDDIVKVVRDLELAIAKINNEAYDRFVRLTVMIEDNFKYWYDQYLTDDEDEMATLVDRAGVWFDVYQHVLIFYKKTLDDYKSNLIFKVKFFDI